MLRAALGLALLDPQVRSRARDRLSANCSTNRPRPRGGCASPLGTSGEPVPKSPQNRAYPAASVRAQWFPERAWLSEKRRGEPEGPPRFTRRGSQGSSPAPPMAQQSSIGTTGPCSRSGCTRECAETLPRLLCAWPPTEGKSDEHEAGSGLHTTRVPTPSSSRRSWGTPILRSR